MKENTRTNGKSLKPTGFTHSDTANQNPGNETLDLNLLIVNSLNLARKLWYREKMDNRKMVVESDLSKQYFLYHKKEIAKLWSVRIILQVSLMQGYASFFLLFPF